VKSQNDTKGLNEKCRTFLFFIEQQRSFQVFYLGCAIQTYVKMYCYMYLRVGSPVPGEGVDVEKKGWYITLYCVRLSQVRCPEALLASKL